MRPRMLASSVATSRVFGVKGATAGAPHNVRVKPPSMAPAYLGLYTSLCEIARAHGYALAPHGTMASDFDLIAVPWTDEATDPRTMVDAIAAYVGTALGLMVRGDGTPLADPERRPHGRLAWAIPLHVQDPSGRVMLDLSVMPRMPAALWSMSSPATVTEAKRTEGPRPVCACRGRFVAEALAAPEQWLEFWNAGHLDFTTETNQRLALEARAILFGSCCDRERSDG